MNDLPEQVPFNEETRPSADVVDLARAAIERSKRRQNERDAFQTRRQFDGGDAA